MKATKAEKYRNDQEESSDLFGKCFSENFRVLRAKAGLTLQDVADKLGAGIGTVQAWENGAVPRAATLRKVSDLFGYPVLALTSRRLGPMVIQMGEGEVLEEPQAIYGDQATAKSPSTAPLYPQRRVREKMIAMSEDHLPFARNTAAPVPTEDQLLAAFKLTIEAARAVPGGYGYVWSVLKIHLSPEQIKRLAD